MEQAAKPIPMWVKKLCSIVSEHIGYDVKWENVHSDDCGWKGYIASCSLFPELPLIMCDEEGELHIILPSCSYKSLQNQKYSVETLFENSYWHYGYYHGGCDMFKAIFWQPLEGDDAVGMTDRERIKGFFTVLSSKDVTEEDISKLCPKDDRKVLAELMRERVYNIFGFVVSDFFMYESNEFSHKVIIKPASVRDTVEVYLPSDILTRLMYYPGVIDCQHFADHTEFWLGRPFGNEQVAVPKSCAKLDDFCRNFWRDLRWYNDKK